MEQRGQRGGNRPPAGWPGAPHAGRLPRRPQQQRVSSANSWKSMSHVPDAGRQRLGMRQALQQQRVLGENCANEARPEHSSSSSQMRASAAEHPATSPRRAAPADDSVATTAPAAKPATLAAARRLRAAETAHHQEDLHRHAARRSNSQAERARAPDHPAHRPAGRRRRSGATSGVAIQRLGAASTSGMSAGVMFMRGADDGPYAPAISK